MRPISRALESPTVSGASERSITVKRLGIQHEYAGHEAKTTATMTDTSTTISIVSCVMRKAMPAKPHTTPVKADRIIHCRSHSRICASRSMSAKRRRLKRTHIHTLAPRHTTQQIIIT